MVHVVDQEEKHETWYLIKKKTDFVWLDTEAAKAARRQLKEAIYSALFGMNVPAVCAVSQVLILWFQNQNCD